MREKKKHTKTVYVTVPEQQEVRIDINLIPKIELDRLCDIILRGAREYYADPANRLASETEQITVEDAEKKFVDNSNQEVTDEELQ